MTVPISKEQRNHEQELIRAFFLPQRRSRYLELLLKPHRRQDVLREFGHFKHIGPRFVVQIAPNQQNPANVLNLLRAKGAPESCFVISEWEKLDGQQMALSEALSEVIGAGMGTFVSCLAGRLVYFEDEEGRCILERASSKRLERTRR